MKRGVAKTGVGRRSDRSLESFRRKLEAENPAFKKAWDVLEAKRRIVSELLRLRKRANLTQKELAEKAGWAPSFVSRLESFPREGEKLNMPDVATLMRYAEICGSSFGMIFAEPKGRGSGIHISGALGFGDNTRVDHAMEALVDTDLGIRDKTVLSVQKA